VRTIIPLMKSIPTPTSSPKNVFNLTTDTNVNPTTKFESFLEWKINHTYKNVIDWKTEQG
jgi:hypothetical protein